MYPCVLGDIEFAFVISTLCNCAVVVIEFEWSKLRPEEKKRENFLNLKNSCQPEKFHSQHTISIKQIRIHNVNGVREKKGYTIANKKQPLM